MGFASHLAPINPMLLLAFFLLHLHHYLGLQIYCLA